MESLQKRTWPRVPIKDTKTASLCSLSVFIVNFEQFLFQKLKFYVRILRLKRYKIMVTLRVKTYE